MTGIEEHVPRDLLESGYAVMETSPDESGTLEMIVVRPRVDERTVLEEAELDVESGLIGDNWTDRMDPGDRDDAARDRQITLMNTRIAGLLSPNRDRWPLAGDQLYVDLDLSKENLQPGQRLRIGEAEIEITAVPHLGCKKFMARFGVDALAFISTKEGKAQRMRGVYARVTRPGRIRTGDDVEKVTS